MPRACPAVLRCRDPRSLRASLTILSSLEQDEILDMRSVTWIDVGVLVLLHRKAQDLGSVKVYKPRRDVTREYIEDQIRSRGQFLYSLEQPNRFPVRYVPSPRSLKAELRAWRQMLEESEAVTEEEARMYAGRMTEVLTNSFTHGRTRHPCVLGGQTFPKTGHSSLVAVDSGRSIPTTLRNSGHYPGDRDDHEWIAMAFREGITAGTEPTNRGLGLAYLQESVEANGGSLLVVSGDGLAYIKNGGNLKSEPLGDKYDRFDGTFILLDLRRG